VSWQGFVLHPEIPVGGIPAEAMFPEPHRSRMFEQLTDFAAAFGVELGAAPERLPNTRVPLAATEWARDQGLLSPFRNRLMEAFWAEGRDIEDVSVLREAAERCGLDPAGATAAARDHRYLARVDAASTEARERGITGIPTFLFGRLPVIGCQSYEHLAHAAERAGAIRRLPAANNAPTTSGALRWTQRELGG